MRAVAILDLEQDPAAPDSESAHAICRCILGLADTLEPECAPAKKRVEVEGYEEECKNDGRMTSAGGEP